MGLTRSLGLRDLVIMGVILVQPTAPMPLFGELNQGRGHAVTTILIAMVAMMFTAVSYGRMARVYPSAGSAYTYVGQEIHPSLGYLTGWSMLMDYVLNPLICTIWCSEALLSVAPWVTRPGWIVFFAALFTMLNLRRIQATAKTNAILAGVMGLVIVWMIAATVKYVAGLPDLSIDHFTRPFYDPQRFSWTILTSGASLAVLTYIGFDGISTLSEEVKNPRRNVLLAMVLVCLIIGVLSAIEVYAAQLVWPSTESFGDRITTGYVEVARRVGGGALAAILNITLVVASIGSGSGGQLAGARLLYGMGRDNALPSRFFGQVDRHHIPANNVILIGVICLVGAFFMSYGFGALLLNFGALIGFMGVNVAAFLRYFVRGEQRSVSTLVAPVIGFLICLGLWVGLSPSAKLVGLAWLVFGVLYGAWKTNWFRNPIRFEIPPE